MLKIKNLQLENYEYPPVLDRPTVKMYTIGLIITKVLSKYMFISTFRSKSWHR